MKVLLTGATGFLGFRTLEKLIACDDISSITATGRKLLPERTIDHPKVIYQLGELENETFVRDLVKDVDVIINTASLSSPWGKEEAFIRANIETQKYLIKFAKEFGISRFIYISSPSIYYNGKNRLLVKENDPLPKKFVNQYAKTKFGAEELLRASDLPFVILRPRALIGRGDTIIMPRVVRAYDEGKLRIIGDGKNVVDLTSVENVAEAILLSLKAEGKALNQAYNITNGESVNLWENANYVLSEMGKEPVTKTISLGLVNAIAGFLEFKSKITNYKEPALTKYGIGTLAHSFTLDISKAKKLLGYSPKVTTQQGIDEFIIWYKSNENL